MADRVLSWKTLFQVSVITPVIVSAFVAAPPLATPFWSDIDSSFRSAQSEAVQVVGHAESSRLHSGSLSVCCRCSCGSVSGLCGSWRGSARCAETRRAKRAQRQRFRCAQMGSSSNNTRDCCLFLFGPSWDGSKLRVRRAIHRSAFCRQSFVLGDCLYVHCLQ